MTANGANTIAVIDYGAGNLHSVFGALGRANATAVAAETPHDLCGCAGMILPGVGAFGYAADALHKSGFADEIRARVQAGVPLLGICLGMQLLFAESEESPGAQGLGLLPGTVTRLQAAGRKLPHMGWTSITPQGGKLMQGIKDGDFAYFVHSYAVHSEGLTVTRATYGEPFDAAVEKGNVFATQFHPEKSSATGGVILGNFLRVCADYAARGNNA